MPGLKMMQGRMLECRSASDCHAGADNDDAGALSSVVAHRTVMPGRKMMEDCMPEQGTVVVNHTAMPGLHDRVMTDCHVRADNEAAAA